MKNAILIATSLLLVSGAAASAASVDFVKDRQADRIEQGRETGKITWTEGLRLRAEQNKIARTEAAYRSDGYLSASERRTLHVMQNEAAEHIGDERHNGWSRVWWLPRVGR
jgi:hypothetical protein